MKKQKLIFAVDEASFNRKDHIGVRKKVDSQLNVFRKNGIEAQLQEYHWENGAPTIIVDDDTTILYFRRVAASYKFASFLLKLRKAHKDLRIIMELPIYPFAKEKTGFNLKTEINEFLGTHMWHLCLDRIVVISHEMDSLYGVKIINVHNGIDFEKVRQRKISDRDSINLIAVSGCYFWHGYDRLINGLGEYYGSAHDIDVNLYLVGEGECSEEYRTLSDRYGLTDKHVYLCGLLDGEKLDEIYDKCDIAVNSLGGHRKDSFFSSSLKSREYVAKGLPIMASASFDIENDRTGQWFFKVPADDTAIDVESIVEYYKTLYSDDSVQGKKKVASEIRNTFREYCDINDLFRPVVEYVLRDE